MDEIIWKAREVKDKIADPKLLELLGEVMPIYNTSEFYVKVAGLGSVFPDVKVTGMGSFQYQNRILFQYVLKRKVEATKEIYEACRKTGSLAGYDFAVVDNRYANSFYLLFLREGDSFRKYAPLPQPGQLSVSQREELYRALEALAKEGVFPPLGAISRRKADGELRLFDYSGVIVDKGANPSRKQEYLDFHRKILAL